MDVNSLDRGKDKPDDAPINLSPETQVCTVRKVFIYKLFVYGSDQLNLIEHLRC